jgi:hypothetical protein
VPKIEKQNAVAEGTETVLVPLAGLPDGLYVCQVSRDGRVLGTTKLSIVRCC